MILCIDKNSLKQSLVVQKDTDLGELIKNHAKYFHDAEEALKQGCNEIDMVVNITDVKNGLYGKVEEEIRKEALSYTAECCSVKPALLGDEIGDYAALITAVYGMQNEV